MIRIVWVMLHTPMSSALTFHLVTAVCVLICPRTGMCIGPLPNLHQGMTLRGKGRRTSVPHDNTVAMICHCIDIITSSSSTMTVFCVGISISGVMTLRWVRGRFIVVAMAMCRAVLMAF